MTAKNNQVFRELSWKQARSTISEANPTLAAAIDCINPDDSHKLYAICYNYGQEVIKNGRLFADDPTDIPECLNYYNANPIGIVIEKNFEMYLNFKNRVLSYALFEPGTILDLNKVFNNNPLTHCSLWGVSSGVRSTFMLAKISEEGSHARLKNYYAFNQPKPLSFFHHWNIFKAIANSEKTENPWSSEIIFFSKKWFEHQEEQTWMPFNYLLLKQAWQKNMHRRDQYFLNTIASILQEEKGVKFSLSNLELTTHLVAIALGEAPGFRPALNNESLPLAEIQEAYLKIYGLDYAPIIMAPSYFNMLNNEEHPIYYSLNYPSCIYFSPKESKKSSIIYDIYELGRMLRKYLDEIAHGDLGLKGTPLHYIAKHCSFTEHHTEAQGEYANILKPDTMENDAGFHKLLTPKLKFPKSSSFFNGCVRLSKKAN